jgi:hypothetical protein
MQLAAGEPFDDQHDAGARWTAQAGWLGRIDVCCHVEQSAATCEGGLPSSVGEEAEVADANQSFGQNVKKKSAQELIC